MSDAEPVETTARAAFELEHADLVERIRAEARLAECQRIREVFSEADGFPGDLRPYLKAVWPVAFETGGTAAQAAQAVLSVRRPAAQATEKLKATLRTMTPAEALEARLLEEREEAFAAGVAAELRRAAKVKQDLQRAKRQRQAQRRKQAAQERQLRSNAHQPGATA